MRTHSISLTTFKNAYLGILTAVNTQTNMRIHFGAAASVFLLAAILKVTLTEGLILVLTVGLVMTAEMANTALEFLADTVTLEKNEGIKHAKDVAAGGVLLAAIFSVIIGFLIFAPKIISFIV